MNNAVVKDVELAGNVHLLLHSHSFGIEQVQPFLVTVATVTAGDNVSFCLSH